MAHLKLDSIRKSFGAVEVLKGIDLEVATGEFTVFVGPSGCGKSTLLRAIAGLEDITSGAIALNGRRIDTLEPADRGVAMVFQNYALYPHMTVGENMSFGLRMARVGRALIAEKVAKAAEILQIGAFLDRKPKALSGGQRQRVAIGRAIVREPEIFLFDEPLSNLDAKLRVQMRLELTKLHRQLGATMIYVTHDQVEAMTMADKIVILNHGRVEQVGSPLELYQKPANIFVAGFIGSPGMNFFQAEITACTGATTTIRLRDGASLSLPFACAGAGPKDEVTLGVRPQAIRLNSADGPHFTANVEATERLGNETFIYGTLASAEPVAIHAAGDQMIASGQKIGCSVDVRQCHLFDKDGKALVT